MGWKNGPYVVMKYFGEKSCQATYPQGISLLFDSSFDPSCNLFWGSKSGGGLDVKKPETSRNISIVNKKNTGKNTL